MKARLPARYSIPARNKAAFDAAVTEESSRLLHEYDSYTIDIVITELQNALTCAARVFALIEEVRKTVEQYCDRYGHDSAMFAMRHDLREYGVEYEGRDKNE